MIEKIIIGKNYLDNIREKVCVLASGEERVFFSSNGVEKMAFISFCKDYWSELPEEKPVKKTYAYVCPMDGEVRQFKETLPIDPADDEVWERAEEYDIVYPQEGSDGEQ